MGSDGQGGYRESMRENRVYVSFITTYPTSPAPSLFDAVDRVTLIESWPIPKLWRTVRGQLGLICNDRAVAYSPVVARG